MQLVNTIPKDMKDKYEKVKFEIEPIASLETPFELSYESRQDGRRMNRKTVGDDKLYNVSSIASGSITITMLKYETATLAFASGDVSKTATVTSGNIIIGVYESVVTSTPATGELQLAISGTTLTGTRSASPGGTAAITYVVVMLKV